LNQRSSQQLGSDEDSGVTADNAAAAVPLPDEYLGEKICARGAAAKMPRRANAR